MFNLSQTALVDQAPEEDLATFLLFGCAYVGGPRWLAPEELLWYYLWDRPLSSVRWDECDPRADQRNP